MRALTVSISDIAASPNPSLSARDIWRAKQDECHKWLTDWLEKDSRFVTLGAKISVQRWRRLMDPSLSGRKDLMTTLEKMKDRIADEPNPAVRDDLQVVFDGMCEAVGVS